MRHQQASALCAQESTTYSSWVSGLQVRQLIAKPEYTFPCDSADWKAHNGEVKCGSIGGKAGALELADAGGWTHAYQEVPVEADTAYTVSVRLYALAQGVCDGTAKVVWCSPSVVVCPGAYSAQFYNEGGCYVGLAPQGNGSWEVLSASFTPTVTTVTVYVAQVRWSCRTLLLAPASVGALCVRRSRRRTRRG